MFFFFFFQDKKVNGDDYTVLDIETVPKNGTKVPFQVGALRIRNGKPEKQYTQDINPECPLNFWAKKNVGLTDEYLSTCPKFYEIADELFDFIGNDIIVGCNVLGSDITPLNNQFEKCLNKKLDNNYINITELANDLIKKGKLPTKNANSETLLSYFGIGDVKHKGLEDCYDEYKLFEELKALNGNETIIVKDSKEKELQKKHQSSYDYSTVFSNEEKGSDYYYVDYSVDMEKVTPNEEETELCAIIKNILIENKRDVDKVYFYKNGSGIVDTRLCWSNIFRFRIAAKSRYILIDEEDALDDCEITDCSKNEAYINKKRMLFDNPDVIRRLSDYIVNEYDKAAQWCDFEGFDTSIKIFANNLKNYDTNELERNAYNRYDLQKAKEEAKLKSIEERDRKRRDYLREQEFKKQIKAEAEQRKKEAIENGTYNPYGKKPIYKMDDNGNILETYESVSEAVSKTGINSKSIRDAAKGVQKHAGGFVWKYKD